MSSSAVLWWRKTLSGAVGKVSPGGRLGTGRFPPSYRFVGQDERDMSMQQLAGWVRDRRAQLELTQEEVAALGPMSDKTVRTVESGRATGLRRHTRTALERALQWQTGSVFEAIEHGLKPQPIAEKMRPSKRRTRAAHDEADAAPTPPNAPAAAETPPADGAAPAATDDAEAGRPQTAAPVIETAFVGGPASAGASFAVARAALKLRSAVGLMRETMPASQFEAALAELLETQREAEIALSQAMQWIVNDDAKRREAGQLLYELQQPL
jgi:transcriptional regulator with XRE-family HTH domain